MIKSKPLISVIIVSYNTRDLTLQAIRSVYASRDIAKKDLEVIVVDNNSSDDTVSSIGSEFQNFRLIVNSDNLGYGRANNQGASIAKGEYLLLLNSDAILAKDSLKVMVDILKKRSQVISVGPKLLSADHTTQPSAGYFPIIIRIIGWMWWLDKIPVLKRLFAKPYHLFDYAWYQKANSPDWLMGACILFRTEQFLSVDGFDENIFMYSEEVELYLRLHHQYPKKSLLYTPKTAVVHLGRSSSSRTDAISLRSELSGIKYIYGKHYPDLLWFVRFILYTGVVLRLVIFSLIPSRRGDVAEYKQFFKQNL